MGEGRVRVRISFIFVPLTLILSPAFAEATTRRQARWGEETYEGTGFLLVRE